MDITKYIKDGDVCMQNRWTEDGNTMVALNLPDEAVSGTPLATSISDYGEPYMTLTFHGDKVSVARLEKVVLQTDDDNEISVHLSEDEIKLVVNSICRWKDLEKIQDKLSAIKREPGFISNEESAKQMLAVWDDIVTALDKYQVTPYELEQDTYLSISDIAQDVAMDLHNAGLSEDAIRVNKQLLDINWDEYNNRYIQENARMDIAFEYFCMKDYEKSIGLLEEYLEKDPMWGWGWIEYLRELRDIDKAKYKVVRQTVEEKLKSNEPIREIKELREELMEHDKEDARLTVWDAQLGSYLRKDGVTDADIINALGQYEDKYL